MRTKDEIRALIREKRRGLDPAWVDASSVSVARQVADLSEFRKASVVADYVAMPGEVRTDALIERCWEERKRVCVPAYRREMGRYELAGMDRDTRMILGLARILEPDERAWVSVDDVDLVLAPGLAFDAAGGRVGHGQGHYDRMLGQARTGTPLKVALAFEFQMLDRVPMDETDARMDVIVTEARVIRATSAASAI